MNKVKKRILCMLLCVVLLASLLPAAFADDGTVEAKEEAEVGKYAKFSYTAGDDFSETGAITVNFQFDATKMKLKELQPAQITSIDENGVTRKVSAVSFSQTDIDTANTMGTEAKFGACWVDPYLGMTASATDVLLIATFEIVEENTPSVEVVNASFHSVDTNDLSEVTDVLAGAAIVSATAPETVIEVVEKIILRKAGDVNGDETVNGKDLTRLLQYLAEWGVEINESNSNVNGDDSVTGKDATRLAQYLAEWDVTLD